MFKVLYVIIKIKQSFILKPKFYFSTLIKFQLAFYLGILIKNFIKEYLSLIFYLFTLQTKLNLKNKTGKFNAI